MQKDGSTPIEAIDPGSLQKRPSGSGARRPRVTRNTLAGFVFVVLAAGTAGVFFVLPEHVAEKRLPVPSASEPPRAVPAPPEAVARPLNTPGPAVQESPGPSAQEIHALRLRAEALLLDVIEKQKALQQQGARLWAADEWAQAVLHGQAGDEHFRKQAFADAVRQYEQAVHALQELESRAGAVLAEQLELGEQALDRNQGDTAMRHFELARTIDPHNRRAVNGFRRAQTVRELFSLLEKGGNLEAANRQQEAEQTYRQAVELDPLSVEARTALDRVSARLTEAQLSQLIAQAYSLLGARQFEDARAAFRAAKALVPDSEQPGQGLRKVDQAVRDEKIAALRVEAEHFEDRQEWPLAAQSWQQLLALAPDAAFAADGAARAQLRATLMARLKAYTDNRHRLSTENVSAEARGLLEHIASLKDNPGSRILQAAAKLEEMLALARQPVPVTLQSDNQTEVTVFRVARLGRFQRHDLLLKPGTYTIVGSRPGYRDVRKTLDVTPDMESGSISIRCEETI